MKIRATLLGLLVFGFVSTGHAQSRFILRASGGLPVVQAACSSFNCSVVTGLDGARDQVFLVTAPQGIDPGKFINAVLQNTGITNAEFDQTANVADGHYRVPAALTDSTSIPYYGTNVIDGYVHQPATSLIRLAQAQSTFNVSGGGVVAIIDTGADPTHPALKNVLLPGYDFTRNAPESDERLDVLLPGIPVITGTQAFWTNQRSAAMLDQSTAAVIDGNSQYGDFGHGTMVAGVVHLAAPTTEILPLKAFRSDGTGYNSDIIRAIYYAVDQNVSVINMSFNLAGYSQEVKNAIDVANLSGIVSVAAAGNAGNSTPLYPASYSGVTGIASTTNNDQLSSFSSYGNTVWVGAPGEGVVTTYPFGTYAAAWGTSFSAPFISGTVGLMRGMQLFCNQDQGGQAVAHAQPINAEIGHGRLDVYQAIQAWSETIAVP